MRSLLERSEAMAPSQGLLSVALRGTLPVFLFIILPSQVIAEVKEIIAEATYIMGDAETPAFAEAMALQQAKQRALEEAGTYVQSYTKTRTQDLTVDEVQTIAGGLMQTDVLEKTRTLISDGLRVSITIKATVAPDRVEELARRIRGTHMAEEYKNLQRDYARLTAELESIKQSLRASGPGLERASLINQLREEQQRFEVIQQKEGSLFERLVSGGALVAEAEDREKKVAALIKTLMERGHNIELGTVRSEPGESPSEVRMAVPITVSPTPTFRRTLKALAEELNGRAEFPHKLFFNSRTYPYGWSFEERGETSPERYEFRGGGALLHVEDEKSPLRKHAFRQLENTYLVLHLFFTDGKQWTCYSDKLVDLGSGYTNLDQTAVFENYVPFVFKKEIARSFMEDIFKGDRDRWYKHLRESVVEESRTAAFMWPRRIQEPKIRLPKRRLQELQKVIASYAQIDFYSARHYPIRCDGASLY